MKTRFKIPLIVGIIIVISMIFFIGIILFITVDGMPQEGYCSEINKNVFCVERSIFQDFRDEFEPKIKGFELI